MNLSIQTILKEELDKERSKEKKLATSWHPSSLGSCLTGAYLARIGIPPDIEFDDRTLRVFSMGRHIEDWLIELIEKSGTKVERGVRIEWPEVNVTGYVDLIIEDEKGNKLPYEIKSRNSRSFWYMEKQGQGANRQHEMQLWTYLHCLKLEEGRLIYCSKDDLSLLEFIVRHDDVSIKEEVTEELEILNRALKENLPPKPSEEVNWKQKYCRWHKQCINQLKYSTI